MSLGLDKSAVHFPAWGDVSSDSNGSLSSGRETHCRHSVSVTVPRGMGIRALRKSQEQDVG